MSVRARRLAIVAAAIGVVAFACPGEAHANGRFPRANQLVVDPTNPARLVMRTTYGLAQSKDGGAHWTWICEESFGVRGIVDPMLGISKSGTLFAATPTGLMASSDADLCGWASGTPVLDKRDVVDLAVDPLDANHVIAVSTNYVGDGGISYDDVFAISTDGGKNWSPTTGKPSTDFIVDTVDFAPKSGRIYASGIHASNGKGVIARSDDGGGTWSEFEFAIPANQSVYIGGVDPNNADRIFVRLGVDTAPDDSTLTPNDLYVSDDAGKTVRKIWTSTDRMYGFALSPDGKFLAAGGRHDGVLVVDTTMIDTPSAWTKRFAAQAYCLTWNASGLYVCATELSGFTLGKSPDGVASIAPLYHLEQLARNSCGAGTSVGTICTDAIWQPIADLLGVDAGSDGGVPSDAGLPETDASAGDASADAGGGGGSKGCGCRVGVRERAEWAAFALVGVALIATRRRRQS